MNSEKLISRDISLKHWKGYSIEELRYRRALNEVAIEIQKDKIMRQVSEALPNKDTGASMLSRAIGALTYMDYLILAFKLFTRFGKMYRAWKK